MGKLALAGLVLLLALGAGHRTAPLAAGQAGPGTPCAWKLQAVLGTEVRFGDATATYWRENFSEPAGSSKVLVLTAEFPHSRYFAIHAYDNSGRLLDGLFDQQIGPDAGSANPFLPGAARDLTPRRFTVRMKFTQRPASPEPNTVYLGKRGGRKLKGAIVYRVYFPDEGRDRRGGVPDPQLFAQAANGSPAACPPEPGKPVQIPNNLTNLPSTSPISWRRYVATAGISNPDVSYLAATFDLQRYGPLLVLRFQRPTFPDTYHGEVVRNDLDMRHLSMSAATLLGKTVASRADSLISVNPNGNLATIVISRPGDKPSEAALTREFATWMDVGALGGDEGRLLYRNTVENNAFQQAVGRVPEGSNAAQVAAVMGAYYPDGIFCTRQAFEADGCPNAP